MRAENARVSCTRRRKTTSSPSTRSCGRETVRRRDALPATGLPNFAAAKLMALSESSTRLETLLGFRKTRLLEEVGPLRRLGLQHLREVLRRARGSDRAELRHLRLNARVLGHVGGCFCEPIDDRL